MNKFNFGSVGLLILVNGMLWGAVYPSTGTVKNREAALALGEAKDVTGVETQLLQAMENKDAMTRALAVESAGKLKASQTVGKITQLLASDPSAEVRVAAAMSLRQMNNSQAAAALSKALNDTSVNVRTTALLGIAQYKDVQARPQVEAAAKDKAPEVRRTVAYVLGRLDDQKSIPVVEGMLKDSDAYTRAGAAQTLGLLHAKGSLPALQGLLKDSDKGVQASAARTLLMLGDASGLDTAKSLVASEEIPVRLLAIDTLGWSKDPSAGSILESLKTTAPANSQAAVREALRRHERLRKRK